MPKPFDATLKELVTNHPVDWLTQLGVPVTAPLEVLNVDLSTVTAAADVLLKVGEMVVHIDIESGPDDYRSRRMLLDNVLAHNATGLPVHTVVVLLRSNAGGRDELDGVEYAPRHGRGGLAFRYEVVRAWELAAADVLNAGVGFLPLAVLGQPPPGQTRLQALPGIIDRIAARTREAPPDEADVILTASYILATMHAPPPVARTIFSRVSMLKDFPGYKFIMNEGATEHTRDMILKQGTIKFGDPTDKQANKIKAIEDLDRLDRMALKLITAKNWAAVLRVK